MHILLTADAIGGVWTYALDLIRALPQHQFSLATMGARPTQSQREAVAKLPSARLWESEWKLEWMENPWDDVARAGEWLLHLEADLRPDIVHLNGFAHGILPFRAPTIVVAHSCVLSWWRAVKHEEAPPEWNRYRAAVAAGLGAAHRVVSPTQAFLHELRHIYGDFGAAQVIPNGTATSPQRAAKEPFVLGAGRLWDEAKNVALLDSVAVQLSWPLRVAGQAEWGAEAFRAGHLELLGALEAAPMRRMMAQASIWAHPARYEPFGLAVLEAAGAGCALVLSDIPTLRELWNGAAVFAAPDDVRSWKIALQNLIDDEEARLHWGERAEKRARCYSLQCFGAAYETLYNQIWVTAWANQLK